MAGPTLSRPVKQAALTPYLVGVRIDINTQRVGQRRANEICIDKLYERSHKQMEGVCNEKKSSKHSAHHPSGHAAACGLLGHTNACTVSPTHDKTSTFGGEDHSDWLFDHADNRARLLELFLSFSGSGRSKHLQFLPHVSANVPKKCKRNTAHFA